MGEKCLYNNVQNVVMPDGRNKELRVDVTGAGKPISKVEIRLTDDTDPAFLYVLHVSESDFNIIKVQQGLLVDFANFPVHLIKLLEQCFNSVKGFLLILEEGGLEAYLKVVQPIDLKNLCYVALRIAQGSETEVMRHMCSQILQIKTILLGKEDECHKLQTKISQLQLDMSLIEKHAENEIKQREEEQSKLKVQWSKDMDALREQLNQERKRDLDSAAYQCESLKVKVDDVSKEAAKYKTKHFQLGEKYEQAQYTIRELSSKNSVLEEKQKALNHELHNLRSRMSELEGDCRKKDQEAGQAHSRAEALDKEVARLRNRLARQEELSQEADKEQINLKSALTRMQETTEARNHLVLQLNGDLKKANLIIKERQKEIEKLHSEIQKLALSKSQHEHTVANLELEMKLLRANVERDKSRIRSLEKSEEKLQDQLKNANDIIASKDEQHKKCGDLISYLNRSLNRQQLEPSPPTTGRIGAELHMSAPPAPILYTMGSSLNRAGVGQVQGLHMSGPPLATLPKLGVGLSTRPLASTPLVASAASGGTGADILTRRSYPGATPQPRVQVTGLLHCDTSARTGADRIAFAQTQSNMKEDHNSKGPKRLSHPQLITKCSSKTGTDVITQQMPSVTTQKVSQGGKSGVAPVPAVDKENRHITSFKPSAYFQPNKIITEF